MSHYSVGVIIPKDKIIDTMDELDLNKTQAIDYVLQEKMEPFNENIEVDPYVSTPMDEIKAKFEKIKFYEGDEEFYLNLKNKYKDKDLDSFINDYYGRDYTEEGLLSTYNPNSKWDWYEIGGRWSGCLPTNKQKDYAQIKDIVFNRELSKSEIEEFTEKYNKLTIEGHLFKPEFYLRKYPTVEHYLKQQSTFNTYAILDSEGNWHEPGQMGWFGCSSASPEEEASFRDNYMEIIEKENPESYFVLVDCHI